MANTCRHLAQHTGIFARGLSRLRQNSVPCSDRSEVMFLLCLLRPVECRCPPLGISQNPDWSLLLATVLPTLKGKSWAGPPGVESQDHPRILPVPEMAGGQKTPLPWQCLLPWGCHRHRHPWRRPCPLKEPYLYQACVFALSLSHRSPAARSSSQPTRFNQGPSMNLG